VNPAENPYAVGPDGPVYLTTAEVAARFRTAPSSVRDWRSKGIGPLGIRFGRAVLYPLPEVEEWERRQTEAAKREQRRRARPLEDVSLPARGAAAGRGGAGTPAAGAPRPVAGAALSSGRRRVQSGAGRDSSIPKP